MKDPNASLPVMSASHLSVGYAGHAPTLSDIGFELRPSALTVMLGENGSGKSTLIRTLSGAQAPLSGNVMLGGRPVVSYSLRQRSRLLGMVYTDRAVAGGLTVRETVAIGRQPYTGLFGRLSDSDRLIVDEAMRLAGIEHKAPRYLSDLSDGERQKAMIARVLAQQTPLVILDEPTAFLDVASRIDMMRLLRRLVDEEGRTVLLSTHDVASAVDVADDIWIVDSEQRRLYIGDADEIIESGMINRAFPDRNIAFDRQARDFIYLEK